MHHRTDHRAWTLAVSMVAMSIAISVNQPRTASAAEQRVYVRSIPNEAAWKAYSKVEGTDRFGKFIIDIKSGEIYFIDVNVFKLHADFVLGILLKQEWTRENIIAYNKNYELKKPQFILGYLTHHLKVNKWSFAFWDGDKIDAKGVLGVSKKLGKTFFKKKLPFRANSPLQLRVARQVKRRGLATLTNNQIYKASRYQVFNKGSAVGKLRVVKKGSAFDSLIFDRTEIVLLQETYPDISPVAGILSAVFSTPLAHVNLRAKAWRIPNASFRDAHKKYAKWHGKMVYLEVRERDHVLRLATPAEIKAHETKVVETRTVHLPKANLDNADMAMLTRIRAIDIISYGAKTSNLGEIASAQLDDLNVPKGFGVPFFYYLRHMRTTGLQKALDAMMVSPKFSSDARWRKASLAKLRKAIVDAPLEPRVLDALYKRVRIKLGGKGVFVRSSTNAEDLQGFNGAGLYDTVPNVQGKKALGAAVKQVWASLWNFRAVEERSLFGIDHRQVYAAVLVQVGVNATAAGVLVSKNLFDPTDPDSFTINAKWGLGIRVVQGKRVPEQVLFDISNSGTKIISRSDDPVMLVFDKSGGIREVPNKHAGVILSEARAKRLADAVIRFRPLFPAEHALDVEWLLEGEKIWIVQSRPYVE